MLTQSTSSSNPSLTLFLKGCSFVLVVLYLANCFTPLRFHVDMIRYFAIKECIEYGCPVDSVAAKDYLPYGYTVLLLALSKLGILKSAVLVFCNCIFLFSGLYLVKKIFESSIHPYLFFILVLLNWTIIKFTVHPLSEMQYLFLSMLSLYFFYKYTLQKSLISLLAAFGFGILAFLTRTVGVSLIVALVAGLIWEYRQALAVLIKKNRILIVIIALVMLSVVIFSKMLGLDHYTGVMTKQFKEGRNWGTIIYWHFTDFAETLSNISKARITSILSAQGSDIFFVVAGILCVAGFIYLTFIRKNRAPFIIKAYLFFYFILLFSWPFYDPRFWVPILPLLIAVICQTSFKGKVVNVVLSVPLMAYIIVGSASVGFMTYTSLNKEVMARKHANGVYRNEYETNFFGKPLSDTAKTVDPFLVHLLKEHN